MAGTLALTPSKAWFIHMERDKMTNFRKLMLSTGLAATLALQAGAVWADHGHKRGDHDRQGMEQRMQERADALKTALQLQAGQQAAWDAFQAGMRPPQRHEKGQKRERREALKNMSTPERLDWMKAMKAKRDAHMAQREQSIRTFYAQLDANQQKTFDAQFWMRPDRRGRHGHGDDHNTKDKATR